MRRAAKSLSLSRETLRHLAHIDEALQPPASFPTTRLPDNCHTASCKPYIC